MIVRRVFYYWQFIAVGVLPLWLIVGSSLFGAGGWEVLGVTLSAIALGVALLVVALLFYARSEVREKKAVSWPDVGVLSLWHALIIALGFYAEATPWLSVTAVTVGIGAFWFALWELFDAARRRVRAVIDYIDETAAGSGVLYSETTINEGTNRGYTRPVDPNVIVIPEKQTEQTEQTEQTGQTDPTDPARPANPTNP